MVATGADKADALADVLGPDRDPRRWPGAARRARSGATGSSTRRLPHDCRADRGWPEGVEPQPRHRAGRHADRGLLDRRRRDRRCSWSTARPPTTRRSVSSARASARRRSRSTPSTDAVGARRRRRSPTRSSANSRTLRPSRRPLAADVRRAGRRGRPLVRRPVRARRGPADRRDPAVVSYEGAPTPAGVELSPAGRRGAALASGLRPATGTARSTTFLAEVVGMSDAGPRGVPGRPGLAAPGRRGRARSCASSRPRRRPAASLDALGGVRQPVLQLLGGRACPSSAMRRWPSTSGWRRPDRRHRWRAARGPPHPSRRVRFGRRGLSRVTDATLCRPAGQRLRAMPFAVTLSA